MPSRCTRPAAQTSCGSSVSTYWIEPPARETRSPTGCAKFVPAESVIEPEPTLTIEPESLEGLLPIVTESPTRKPVVLATGITVAPFAAPGGATVVPAAPAPAAATGITVQ